MNEEFALHYASMRAKERGYDGYRILYKEYCIAANESMSIQGYNEIWLITHIDYGLSVTSDYGSYEKQNVKGVIENSYEHSDHIEIINTKDYKNTIRFLQVILKTNEDGDKK